MSAVLLALLLSWTVAGPAPGPGTPETSPEITVPTPSNTVYVLGGTDAAIETALATCAAANGCVLVFEQNQVYPDTSLDLDGSDYGGTSSNGMVWVGNGSTIECPEGLQEACVDMQPPLAGWVWFDFTLDGIKGMEVNDASGTPEDHVGINVATPSTNNRLTNAAFYDFTIRNFVGKGMQFRETGDVDTSNVDLVIRRGTLKNFGHYNNDPTFNLAGPWANARADQNGITGFKYDGFCIQISQNVYDYVIDDVDCDVATKIGIEAPFAAAKASPSRGVVKNSRISRSLQAGITAKGCQDCAILNNVVSDGGALNLPAGDWGRGIACDDEVHGITVVGNEVIDVGGAPYRFKCTDHSTLGDLEFYAADNTNTRGCTLGLLSQGAMHFAHSGTETATDVELGNNEINTGSCDYALEFEQADTATVGTMVMNRGTYTGDAQFGSGTTGTLRADVTVTANCTDNSGGTLTDNTGDCTAAAPSFVTTIEKWCSDNSANCVGSETIGSSNTFTETDAGTDYYNWDGSPSATELGTDVNGIGFVNTLDAPDMQPAVDNSESDADNDWAFDGDEWSGVTDVLVFDTGPAGSGIWLTHDMTTLADTADHTAARYYVRYSQDYLTKSAAGVGEGPLCNSNSTDKVSEWPVWPGAANDNAHLVNAVGPGSEFTAKTNWTNAGTTDLGAVLFDECVSKWCRVEVHATSEVDGAGADGDLRECKNIHVRWWLHNADSGALIAQAKRDFGTCNSGAGAADFYAPNGGIANLTHQCGDTPPIADVGARAYTYVVVGEWDTPTCTGGANDGLACDPSDEATDCPTGTCGQFIGCAEEIEGAGC